MTATGLKHQHAYVQRLKKMNFNFGLTVGDAFVRGIRDIGYKHTGTAIDEQIDNAFQAGSDQVHVIFGYGDTKSNKKPSELAVIDLGHGMEPEMIRASVTWGGTHRENDRSGFGRYGFGLPSSAVSQGQRYTVYSKIEGREIWAVTIDLEEIGKGDYNDDRGQVIVPLARIAKLPSFVQDYIKQKLEGEWTHGTIVVMEKLDKLSKKMASFLHDFLLEHFGVTYHKLRGDFDIYVNGTLVEPIDPLFTTPGYRFYELDEQRAKALEDISIEVKDAQTKELNGKLVVRMSYMPPNFASIDKGRVADRGNANGRFPILRDYNGFIFTRNGRVIDVVTRNPLTVLQNNDRYIKVEVDFSAGLDEYFNISTSKQRIDVSDAIWDRLREAGLLKAIEHLRQKASQERASFREERVRDKTKKRASEEAMERTGEMTGSRPSREDENKRAGRGKQGLVREAARRAQETGQDQTLAQRDLELELGDRSYKVAFDSAMGAPFFRVEQIGGAKVLFINRATRFFQEVHSGPTSTRQVQTALEILLFTIGDRMLDTKDSIRDLYQYEVGEWSRRLEFALGQLGHQVGALSDDVDNGSDVADAA